MGPKWNRSAAGQITVETDDIALTDVSSNLILGLRVRQSQIVRLGLTNSRQNSGAFCSGLDDAASAGPSLRFAGCVLG